MKLFRVNMKRCSFLVVSDDPSSALALAKQWMDVNDYGFSSSEEPKEVELGKTVLILDKSLKKEEPKEVE